MSSRSARITVSRTREDDIPQRLITVSLDGRQWAELSHGDFVSQEVRAGKHTIKADNTLFRKKAVFEVAPDEEIRFQVSNVHGPGTWAFGMIGAPLLYLKLSQEEPRSSE